MINSYNKSEMKMDDKLLNYEGYGLLSSMIYKCALNKKQSVREYLK